MRILLFMMKRYCLYQYLYSRQLMAKAEKSQKCDQGRCKKHAYILKPLQKNMYFLKAQRAKFCPKYNKQTRSFDDCVPKVNRDYKSYTPLFILDDQKLFYQQNDSKMRANHEKRIKDCASKDSLYVPRHARKRQFCSVCKQNYNEYLEHIDQQIHRVNIRKSKYNQYIIELSKQFKKQNKKIEPHPIQELSTDPIIEKVNEKSIQAS